MSKDKKQKAKRALLRLTPEEDPEFQIAPMIDVLLVMLVFFMSISSSEILKNVKGIELPVAANALPPGKHPGEAVLNIEWLVATDSGSVRVGERPVNSLPELTATLQDGLANNALMRVLIRADKHAKWEYVRDVMAAVGNAGVANITFSVVDKEAPPAEPSS